MSLKENKEDKQEKAETTDDRVEIKTQDTPVDETEAEKSAEETPEGASDTSEQVEEADSDNTKAEEISEKEADVEQVLTPEQKYMEMNDKYVRLVAEFENFKRRNTQEMQNRFKFANQALVSDLLAGMDSLERAIEQAQEEENESLKEFVAGIEMAKQLFYEALGKNNIERIVPKGELFDPNKHEAMGVIDTDEIEPDHIAAVFQAGYILHDRVIRPAMVQVVKKK
ncbi:MAG: nucleotide exchange factor GrpE [Deltaproteobacteria bacterium]|jgi:molecular chaperone GrpE|nr:nucleotide exchange factor GrpE [Deltaproteobacteria bacterium]MBT4264552.1 nucleotide exchange factor GrpE [Deltaproteobacteria bacterium]MBT4641375.1 nucleotide exchange factor GrpE [Deltaproteobacteria bacterium]MBT6500650.1 nucleotide exchange factor GrpE [Deltaproteobacteria bacterium]MBT6615063.1 nucleotide exchange factor GrpE [Deltaproteobacteria bacterium]